MVWSQDRAAAAYRFAAAAHQGQTVPGTDLPYLLHVSQASIEVMATLCSEPQHDGDLAVLCALLHDTIEDTSVTYEQVWDEFGQPVADGVLALTKDETLPKAERMTDSLRRIRQQPSAVWIVKLADRIVNLQPPPGYWSAQKKAAYRAEAQQILDALGEASPLLATRLAAKIEAY